MSNQDESFSKDYQPTVGSSMTSLHPNRGTGTLGSNSSARRLPRSGNTFDRPPSIVISERDDVSYNLHHRTSRTQRSGISDSNIESYNLQEFQGDQRKDIEHGEMADQFTTTKATGFDNGVSREIPADSSSIRTENTHLRRRDLGLLDVAALIINKQIGTGIFTTPGIVLGLTGSKSISLVLWLCGGLWAFLSVIIYVEFGSAFPYNGGELIYLDEVFRTPELLPAILFSAFFLFVPNTDGNCIQFAKHVLLAAMPNVTDTTELDKRLISFVAICILTIACFVHYFSRNSGLLLNLLFAGYKTVLVIVFIIAGGVASSRIGAKTDWGNHGATSQNIIGALVYVIYSYQGWENANYVGGELEIEKNALKWGAFLAVGAVTLLYTLVTMVYSFVCSFDDLAGPDRQGQDLGIVTSFAPTVFGPSAATGVKICISLSAFGNLVAVVYTSCKVKQQIARQCFIPFFRFFGRNDKHFDTPLGALILHWIVAAIWILATPNTTSGYNFIIGLFIYGQLVVGVFIAIAFFFIGKNYEADTSRNNIYTGKPDRWKPVILKNVQLRVFFALIFLGMNLMVIIESARKTDNPADSSLDAPPDDPPLWVRPAVIFGLQLVAIFYWALIMIIDKRSNSKSALEIRIVREGFPVQNEKDEIELRRAKMELNSRIIVYEAHGWLKTTLEYIDLAFHKFAKLIIR